MWMPLRNPIVVITVAAALTASLSGTARGQCAGEDPSDSICQPHMIPGAPGLYDVRMDVSAATPDFDAACAPIGHTVWFEIAPTEDSHITFSTCDPRTTYDTVVQAYIDTGDCEFPNRIDSWCDDDSMVAACLNECSPLPRASIVTVQATAGTTYLFQVGSFNGNSAGCELCLGVSVVIGPNPPFNDDCFDAATIGDTTVAFDTTGATNDGPPIPGTCDEGSGTSCVQDIWYRYTASCSGVAMVDLCGSDYDTRLAVYAVDQCPGGLIACNDDFCGFQSRVQFAVEEGTDYLLRVAGYSGSGTGTMTIACSPNVYLDKTAFEFNVAAAGYVELAHEDFTEATLPPPPAEAIMNDPLDAETNNEVFAPGDIVAGLVFQSNLDGPGDTGVNPRGGDGLVAATPITLPGQAVVGANFGPDGFDIISLLPVPPPRPAAIGVTLADMDEAGVIQVSVYDVNDALLSRVTVTGEADGAFVGATPISIPGPGDPVEIGRINVWAPAGTREGVYSVRTYGPPPCATDIDGSGETDFQDLLQLLAAWGPCPGCAADVNGNGVVEFQDLLQLLAAWGPCS